MKKKAPIVFIIVSVFAVAAIIIISAEKVRDWADDRLRRMCGRITPGKRLAVILVMFFFFGGLSWQFSLTKIQKF